MRHNIKIVADGPNPMNVKIVDADTGNPIKGVRAFTIHGEVDKPTTITLEVFPAVIDVTCFGEQFERTVATAPQEMPAGLISQTER